MATVKLKIGGMSCGGCASRIKTALQKLARIGDIRIDLKAGAAEIEGDAEASLIEATVKQLGYAAEVL